ncbi:E3 ubiquitin-protein ligase DTX3L1 [Salarias fasciatus]|uniref:E3 ubiquitin-protein ligase DTX3L1 n=1 Tax=Salarias fasciatus TaxID=181472 RepID=UPI0011769527|nr:E3 ubiquitin-protein ligase DTX3L-like [Salarias fasciatus]
MGSNHSSGKHHCNQYLNGQGPPSLLQQATEQVSGKYSLNDCQPPGQMTWVILHKDLPGFPRDDTVQISFVFPDGMQTDKHPHPGQPFSGRRLSAYLPDNPEGRKVLKLLDKAFSRQLLFTVATGEDGQDAVTTKTIPLKTEAERGSAGDGYPDSDYLKTVRRLLRDAGVQ